MTQEEYSQVCPYLGLADDADSHATYATEAHRCYRLPNPTKIAAPHQETYCLGANHVTCPVYLGEGIPGRGAPAQPPPAAAGAVPGPRGGARGQRPFGQGAPAPRPARRPSPGALGPRPRSGGISLPVATIGLFALAFVIVLLAVVIQQVVGDGGGSTISPADAVATRNALNQTQTAQAASGTPTPPTQQPGTQQAGATGTAPAGTRTPGATTRTPTPGGNGRTTYSVREGDNCFSIAQDHGVTLQQLLTANNLTEDDCTRLAVGQELIIP